jgi:endonuclease/exonuclease/phosphatase family metal-dependent hydrolase
MRICSLNIHAGKDEAGQPSLPEITAALKACNADVILLQEVDRNLPRSGFQRQDTLLAKALGGHAEFYGRLRFANASFGNSIVSRIHIHKRLRLDLPSAGGEPRCAVGISLENGLTFWNVHLGLHHDWRATQLAVLAEKVRDKKGPVIVGGDFNALLEAGEIVEFLERSQLSVISCNHPTFPVSNPTSRIDFLFGRGVTCEDSGVVIESASDHCLIWADISL